MTEEKGRICCMFDNKNPDHAVKNRQLTRIETLLETSRRERYLCWCDLCGAYVLYDYEEIANLNGGWDNADIFESYYPVYVEKTEQDGEVEYRWLFMKDAKWIFGHNMEEDANRRYIYRDD